MPNLIIKPQTGSGNSIILQDQGGGAVLTTADSGVSQLSTPAGHIVWVNSVHKSDVLSLTQAVGTLVDITDMTLTTPTPASSSSKYLISTSLAYGMNGDVTHIYTYIHRSISGGASGVVTGANGTVVGSRTGAWGISNSMASPEQRYTSQQYLDSPSSSTAITYKLQWHGGGGSPVAYLNRSSRDNDGAAYDGRATSSFTIMEIAG